MQYLRRRPYGQADRTVPDVPIRIMHHLPEDV